MTKIEEANERIAEVVVDGNKKIETGVVDGYKKFEGGVVGAYQKIVDGFVEKYLAKEGETAEEAKARIKKVQKQY